MSEEQTPRTTAPRKQWIVRDELGNTVCAIFAGSWDEATDIFCYPALRKEAYFGPKSEWTCEEYQHA